MTCGGCNGLGAHIRWCAWQVGAKAARLGKWSEQSENMADQIGANCPEAANALYRSAAILRDAALDAKAEYQAANA